MGTKTYERHKEETEMQAEKPKSGPGKLKGEMQRPIKISTLSDHTQKTGSA